MSPTINLDGVEIKESDFYFIAEIGHNHQGDINIARDMIRVAKANGANAVKLQKRDNKTLFSKKLYDSPYPGSNSYGKTYGEHREALEFGWDEYTELLDYAREIGITLFATAFDQNSADFLEKLDAPIYKIASGDLNNIPLLKHVASFGKPMIVSTGGGDIDAVRRAYDSIMPINRQLVLLQCTACYPVENYKDMNLRVINTYQKEFPDVVVGLSDHESGIGMALIAYSLGARIIEKHFTLNRAWRGTDQAFSISPTGVSKLVRNLERAKDAMGDGIKRCQPAEEKSLIKMSKKIVVARDLKPGHVLTRRDLLIKSPSDGGLPPYEFESVIGKLVKTFINQDEGITLDNIK